MGLSIFLVEATQSWTGLATYFGVWCLLILFGVEVCARVLAKLASAANVLRIAIGFTAYLMMSCLFVLPLSGLAAVDGWRARLHDDTAFFVAFLLGYVFAIAPACFFFYTHRMPQLQSLGYFQPRHRARSQTGRDVGGGEST